ncbi:unnamed protein product [Effrenium voratum]|nr:unnamed protein product [Effrenium voratum]
MLRRVPAARLWHRTLSVQVLRSSPALEGFVASGDAARLVQDLSDTNACFLISKTACPFCKRAKKLLEELQAECTVYEIDDLPAESKKTLQAHMKALTGAGSVPRIFVQGACEGGFSEVQRKLWAGELVPKLLAAGALKEWLSPRCRPIRCSETRASTSGFRLPLWQITRMFISRFYNMPSSGNRWKHSWKSGL